jgi:prophage tail gpP-like protein
MSDPAPLFLVAGGRRYNGWKSIRVVRTIEGLTGQFALEVSDRWDGEVEPWPVVEGDACQVEIDDQIVISGYIDKRKLVGSFSSRSLSYTGRDRAQDVVDCSLLLDDAATKGNKWTYRNIDIAQFVEEIAKPHGITVSVQQGLTLKKDPLLVAHPGETGFEAIKRAVGSSGVLVVSDGVGGILITRSGATRATALVEGVNIKACEIEYDASERFYRYQVTSQPPGTDEASGESTRVKGEATDVDVKRTNRVLVIRPDKGMNAADARRRADWEARIRAAKSAPASITVQGWRQPTGELWTVNAITRVKAPRLLGIDGDMLISQVEYSIDDKSGQLTTLTVVRPDAFTPQPQTAVVSGEGVWKELAKGAL